jgi:hypothetical protein
MRITKLPIPILIAAAALTSVAVIYVYLTGPLLPIYTDPNFTTPLFSGAVYLWRGAAFQYSFSADSPVSLTYTSPYSLIYLTGPTTNITISVGREWIVYPLGERRLYVRYMSAGTNNYYVVYKLVEVTPGNNSSTANLTMWLPQVFDLNDPLTNRELNAIRTLVSPYNVYRAVAIQVNGTHIIYTLAYPQLYMGGYYPFTVSAMLPTPTTGKAINVNNNPVSSSYNVGSAAYTVISLPYQYFAITPSATTTLTIYVS